MPFLEIESQRLLICPSQPESALDDMKSLRRFGAGGMGEVWKALDPRLDRIVAIKVSKTEFSKRFERGAKAIMREWSPTRYNCFCSDSLHWPVLK
jgi:serine/threonine protein kinase